MQNGQTLSYSINLEVIYNLGAPYFSYTLEDSVIVEVSNSYTLTLPSVQDPNNDLYTLSILSLPTFIKYSNLQLSI